MASIKLITFDSSSNRRRKSPDVVGSGMRRAPTASRKATFSRPSVEVLKTPTASEDCVGHRQDVIRLVVRQVTLQHPHLLIDRRSKTSRRDHLLQHPKATTVDGLDSPRDLVVDVPRPPGPGVHAGVATSDPDARPVPFDGLPGLRLLFFTWNASFLLVSGVFVKPIIPVE